MKTKIENVILNQEEKLQEMYEGARKNRLMCKNSIYLYEYIEFLSEDILWHFQYNIVTGEQPPKEIQVIFSEDEGWNRTTDLTSIRKVDTLNLFEQAYFERLISVYATVSKTDFKNVWILRFKD